MKQKIVTVTKNLKSPSDYQAGFETNIDKWIQAGWQVKQVVSTAFQYQASGIGLFERGIIAFDES